MNLIRFPLLIVISAIAIFPQTPEQQPKPPEAAGEISSIACKAYWRKAGDDKSDGDLLDRKRDRGRKLYVGESVRCVGVGALKLVVYKREFEIDFNLGWRKIEENTAGSGADTSGRPGEEDLSWLTGTYRLDAAASDDPEQTRKQFQDVFGKDARHYLGKDTRSPWATGLFTFGSSPYLAIRSNNRTLDLAYSENQYFSLPADGAMHYVYVANTDFKIRATGNAQLLDLNWGLNDKLNTYVNVQPADNGQKLIITRSYDFSGYDPIVSRMVYHRESKAVAFPTAFPNLAAYGGDSKYESLTGELQKTIDSTELRDVLEFSLLIKEPSRLVGTNIKGRVFRTRDLARNYAPVLVFQIDNIFLPDGKFYRSVVEQITINHKVLHLVATETNSPTAGGGVLSSHIASSNLTEPLVIVPAGSKFVVRMMPIEK